MSARICFLACSCLVIASCVSNEDNNTDTTTEQVSFCVYNETPGSEGAVIWENGDVIDLFLGGKKYSLSSSNNTPSQEAEFQLMLEDVFWSKGEEVWAIFPHSDNNGFDGSSLTLELTDSQTAISGGIDKSLRVSVARSRDSKLTFYNVCSGIRVSLTEDNVVSVSFKSNNAEPLAGKVKVSFDKDGKPMVTDYLSPKTEVVLSAPNGETLHKGEWYYITCFPVELSQGYTVTVTKADGQTIEKCIGDACGYERSVIESVTGVDLEFYVADSSSYSDLFDRITWKDESHILFTNYYDNGMVSEYHVLCESDTLAFCYSRQGFLKMITDGKESLLFGGFDNHSMTVAYVDSSGNQEMADMELEFDWNHYLQTIVAAGSTRSDAGNGSKKQIWESTLQTGTKEVLDVLPKVFPRMTKITPRLGDKLFKTSSLSHFLVTAFLYSLSDDPEYVKAVEMFSVGGDVYISLIVGGIASAGVTVLFYANWYLWKHNIDIVIDNWGSGWPVTHEYEQFYHQLYGEASLTPSSGNFDWQGGSFSTSLTFGRSSFDLNQLEWDVVEKPGFVKINSISKEVPYSVSLTVGVNDSETPRKGQLKVRLINVYDQEDDLVFEIEQDTPMRVTPKSLYFDEQTTKEIFVHSTDSWHVIDGTTFCDITRVGLDTDKDCVLRVTPKDKEYHVGMIVLEATARGTDYEEPFTYQRSVKVEVNCPYIINNHVLCPDGNHPHAIDLGLSVKWACCDVGASNPSEQGAYFAWGETETKPYGDNPAYGLIPDGYFLEDYKWYKTEYDPEIGIISGYTKYCIDPAVGFKGFTDGKTTLDLADDAAHTNWGGGWRMPTKEELDELNRECSWYNSHNLEYGGGLATGPSGNSIYITNRGCYGPSFYFTYGSYHVNYWTSTLSTTYNAWADGYPAWGVAVEKRCVGQAVRPVHD